MSQEMSKTGSASKTAMSKSATSASSYKTEGEEDKENKDEDFGDNVTSQHHARLGQHAVQLWVECNMTDIIIRAADRTFQSHKAVLTCYCPFFKKNLLCVENCDVQGIELLNIKPDAFETLLTYMYTGRLKLTCSNMGDVYRASRLLEMKEVTHVCAQILSGKLGGIVSTMYLYVTAKRMGIPHAWKRAFKVICSRFEEVVDTVEFLQLDEELLFEILSGNIVGARGELTVFLAALRWLHFKFLEREYSLVAVLKCVRFGLMTITEILHCFHPPILPGIMEFPAIRMMILQGVSFISAKMNGFEPYFRQFAPVPRMFTLDGDQCDLLWDLALFDPFFCTDEEIESSVVAIQANWRGYLARLETQQNRQEMNKHATAIQSAWKGYQTRMEFRPYLESLQRRFPNQPPPGTTNDPCLFHLLSHPYGLTGLNDEWKDHPANALTSSAITLGDSETIMLSGGINPHKVDEIATSAVVLKFAGNSSWEKCGRMPSPRHHHCLVFLVRCIYVIGGCDPRDTMNGEMVPSRTCYSYSLDEQKWVRIGNLNHARIYHGAVTLEGIIYAVGGKNEYNQLLSSVETYSPLSEIWEELFSPLCCPRMAMAVVAFRGLLWTIGGLIQPSESDKVFIIRDVECYDPQERMWVFDKPAFPYPRCFLTAVDCEDYLVVLGGTSRSKSCKEPHLMSTGDVYVFWVRNNVWRQGIQLPTARHSIVCALMDTNVYCLGGLSTQEGAALSSVISMELDLLIQKAKFTKVKRCPDDEDEEEEEPPKWTELAELPSPLASMAIVVLPKSDNPQDLGEGEEGDFDEGAGNE